MGFGNPYGEPWNIALVKDAVARIRELGIDEIVLADTVGQATPVQIHEVFAACPGTGAHFHAEILPARAARLTTKLSVKLTVFFGSI